MLHLPAHPDDLEVVRPDRVRHVALAHGPAPSMEKVEDGGDLSAAIVGHEGFEAKNLRADPVGLGPAE